MLPLCTVLQQEFHVSSTYFLILIGVLFREDGCSRFLRKFDTTYPNTRDHIPDIYFNISACSTKPGIFQLCGVAELNITARNAAKFIFVGLIALCKVTLHRAINRLDVQLDTLVCTHIIISEQFCLHYFTTSLFFYFIKTYLQTSFHFSSTLCSKSEQKFSDCTPRLFTAIPLLTTSTQLTTFKAQPISVRNQRCMRYKCALEFKRKITERY